MNSIRITVFLFGQAREIADAQSMEVTVEQPATVGSTFSILKSRYPKLAPMERSLMFAVNEEYAARDAVLNNGDEMAILPPVSGGEDKIIDIFEITREPIQIDDFRARLLEGDSGALVIFDGVVRNNTKGRRTRYLEYEGYDAMALKTMAQIGREVREKWAINRLGIIHRLGKLEISESSVVIIVTSAHRRIAFEACQFAIDRLKQIVPIWKKEFFEDGEVWVEGEAK